MDMLPDPQYRTPDGSALRIWRDAAPNNFLSEKLGRPMFDEVVYCEVIAPGSGNSAPVFELVRFLNEAFGQPEPIYGQKYAEYKQFVEDFEKAEGHDASLTGTPLSQWSEMKRTMIAELKAQKIFTVEALANLPDARLNVVGPDGRTWRDKAAAYIKVAADSAYATELASQLALRNTEVNDLTVQVKALAAQVQQLTDAATSGKAKPGKATTPVEQPVAEPVPMASPVPPVEPVVDLLAPAAETLVPALATNAVAPII